MGFIPPLNLGGFQPSPATLAQWVYQIWQYLQENPIATKEQLQEYIGNFITTSPETQAMIGEGVEQYLTENPPTAPVQSVQGKTGAVQLAYNEIVPASNAVPVYKASSTPSTNTLVGQYNIGYRLFVNTATQEIFTISPAGALSLVGRGKFDGTTIDLNSAQGDTTINEAIAELDSRIRILGSSPNLLPWGSYSVSSNIINLSDSIENYDLIVLQSGTQTDQAAGAGYYFNYLFKPELNHTYGGILHVNAHLVVFSVNFLSNTTIKVETAYDISTSAAYTGVVLRQIIGLKLTA